MSSSSRGSRFTRFVVHHYVELFTAVAVLFILQTGLVPFDFGAEAGPRGSAELFGRTISDFTYADIISNIFLYIPVGLLFHWSFYRRVRNTIAALLLAVAAGAALSGGIEFLQTYASSRFSSIIDFTCNILGTGLGALISLRCRLIIPAFLRAIAWEFQEQPHVAIIKAYACVLVVVAAMPFSFSLDTTLFKKSLKTVTLVPFGAMTTAHAEGDAALASENSILYAYAKWRELKCWSRWAVELAAFATLAWLICRALTADYGFSRGATTALVWWLCGGLAVMLSLLQLPLVTRAFDVTDILFRFAGIGVGLLLRSKYIAYARALSPQTLAQAHGKLAITACAATLAYIVYVGLIPFTIDFEGGGPSQALSSSDFLPFFAYFAGRFDLMMADVMEKFVAYAAFAALLATVWTRARALETTTRALVLSVVGAAIAALLEIVQMYIPVRVPSLTDLILAACGSAVGVLAQERAAMFYRLSTSRDAGRAEAPESARTPQDGLAPADALIATLMEPYTEAPKERIPKHTHKSP